MPTVVCHHCSETFTVDGPKPDQCPSCGRTLHIEGDPTPTGPALHSTIIHIPERNPVAFGRYIVQSRLGAGGFGTVFLAQDPQLKRPVAIKVPRGETGRSPLGLERFAREARNIAQLRHENIVSVFDVELDGEPPFIVCDYVNGETLSDRTKREPLSFREAAQLIADVAKAVAYAHKNGIIHRDIKPSNIMIDSDGNPRLMDFGLAKREAIDNTVTTGHAILGTPAYMSPEQAWGGKRGAVDRRSDIYSLGTVLYQLLTRELPFRGEPRMVLRQVIEDDPKSPRTLNADIPRDLETICEKAMQKEPASRYQTAGALADDLNHWLRDEPIEARPATRLKRSVRWCRRNPAAAGLIIGALAFLVALSGGLWGYAAVQTSARRNSENARKEIEEVLRKKQELLARAYGERGERQLRAAESSDEYAPTRALPWLLEAMKVDEQDPDRLLNDRVRLRCVLESTPRVEGMWFFDGDMTAAGISPQRDRFFIAGQNGTVKIWKIDGDKSPVVLDHPGTVWAGTFSPDGSRLATSAIDGLRIWETTSGKRLLGPLLTSLDPIAGQAGVPDRCSITFSRSGRFLFTSAYGRGNRVWNVETGQPVGKLIAARGNSTAEFADSDRLLVLNFEDATHFYEVQTGVEKKPVPGAEKFVAIRLSPDGATLANCTRSGPVVLWNTLTGKETGRLAASDSGAMYSTAEFSPDGKLFATADDQGVVKMWNVDNAQLLWRQRLASGAVDGLRFSPDRSALLVFQFRPKLCTVATRSGLLSGGPIHFAVQLNAANWLKSPDRILAVDEAGVARIWNIAGQTSTDRLPVSRAHCSAVSSDSRVLAAAELNRRICLLRSAPDARFDPGGAEFIDVDGGGATIHGIALSADGSLIAVAAERDVSVFNTVDKKKVCGPLRHSGNVVALRFTPDATRIVCVSWDGRAAAWNLATGNRLHEALNIGPSPTGFDLDIDAGGKYCAVATHKGATVWSLEDGKRILPGSIGGKNAGFARFVNDPSRILVACPIGRRNTQIWDFRTGQPVASLLNFGKLQWVDISANKDCFLTASSDGIARLWSVRDATPASPPFEHRSPVRCGAIDPTARFVLTVTDDLTMCLWNVSSAELLSTVSLRRSLSRTGLNEFVAQNQQVYRPLAFFAAGGRFAYVLLPQGLLVTQSLEPDLRSPQQIEADVAARSGCLFDGAGGLRGLQGRELATLWQIRDPSRLGHSATASPR